MKWKYQNFLDRQTWLDFVKGLLIFLVVLGHSIAGDRAKNYDIIGITHYFIYSIHMPMFMLISGYLSKKPVNIKKAVKNYLIPYIIFDCLYLVGLAVRGQEVSWNILFPTYVYWYILALFIMRIILSTSNNFLVALILFVLSFFSVTITEHTWTFLSLGRVFLLYPIFYLGYRIQPMTIDRLRKSKCGRWIVTGLCAVCIGMEMEFLKAGIVDITWATHDYSSNILDYFVKYIYMFVFVIIIFALLSVISPSNENIISRWGRNSILVYLLHPFLVDIEKTIINKFQIVNSNMILILFVVCAVFITDFLSRDFLMNIYNLVFNRFSQLINLGE